LLVARGTAREKDQRLIATLGFLRIEPMVDLVGIEPTTSSMPWNWKKCKLLTAKGQKIDWVWKNPKNCRS
jgi:hypothetical protein